MRSTFSAPLASRASEKPSAPNILSELTIRGMLIGGAITVVFMAANVYLGLRTGMTFSSSIPAAIISMSALRALGHSGIRYKNHKGDAVCSVVRLASEFFAKRTRIFRELTSI